MTETSLDLAALSARYADPSAVVVPSAARRILDRMVVYHERMASVRYPITERDGVAGRSCKDCGVWKPLTEFYRISGGRKPGKIEHLTRCKPCHVKVCGQARRNRERDKEWHHENRERRGLRTKALKYRIPEDELVAMLAAGCRICGGFDRLHIDHDHATGITRGILCRGCNHGLGNFGDDPERLRAALVYLEAAKDLAPRPALPHRPAGRKRVA